MSRPKKQKDDPEIKKESDLYKILINLNKHNDEAIRLVSELEKVPEKSITLEFCQTYTILLFKEYIDNENDREMMLAMCGLLKGFEFKPRKFAVRMGEYREHAKYYNDFFKGEMTSVSIGAMCRVEMLRIARELEERLVTKLAENEDGLGLINAVPKKLELPAPRSISADEHNTKQDTPSEEIIIDISDDRKIVITKILSNTVKKITTICKSNTTNIKIIMVLALIIAANLSGIVWYEQDYKSHMSHENKEYITGPLRNDTLEEGQKKQTLIPITAPCKEVIIQGNVSGSIAPPK